MTRQHFIDAFEEELRRQRIQFTQGDVKDFVDRHWSAIVNDPDPRKWSREFLDRGHGSVTV